MNQEYLIDGYNLMYAAGMMPERDKGRGLQKARGHLVRTLAYALRHSDRTGTVVFDANQRFPGSAQHESFHGVEVLFATDYEEADDMIEELVKRSATPRNLIVVSDDHRVQRAAKRRRCTIMSCERFQDELEKMTSDGKRKDDKRREAEAPLTDEEKKQWLDEFSDLQDDPAMKELFDPFGFNEALE